MDDRALSSTLGYTLTLAIATILVTGLLVASGGFVENQREAVTRSELEVVSQQFMADAGDAGQIAAGTPNSSFDYRATLPSEAVGSGYTLNVTDDGNPDTEHGYVVTVTSDAIDVEVSANFTSPTALAVPFDVKGGTVEIRYDADGSGELEVSDA